MQTGGEGGNCSSSLKGWEKSKFFRQRQGNIWAKSKLFGQRQKLFGQSNFLCIENELF